MELGSLLPIDKCLPPVPILSSMSVKSCKLILIFYPLKIDLHRRFKSMGLGIYEDMVLCWGISISLVSKILLCSVPCFLHSQFTAGVAWIENMIGINPTYSHRFQTFAIWAQTAGYIELPHTATSLSTTLCHFVMPLHSFIL